MAYDAGTAFLQIVPGFRGFGAAVRREAAAAGRDAGRVFGEEFNRTAAGAGGRTQVGPDRASSARQGQQSAGAFADAFRARLDAARRSFKDIEIGAATSAAEQQIKDLQARMVALRDARIGVDIDAGAALAELEQIRQNLIRLEANSPDITVRVNSARAAAELKLLQEQINRIDGQNPVITPVVDPAPAVAGIGLIGIAALALLPILIPIGAAGSAALAGIATGAFVAAAGIGVLVLGLFKVVQAVTAGAAADKAAGKASSTAATQRISAANAADGLRSAERSLANTKATAAAQAKSSARAIADAERNLSDARQNSALTAQQSARRIADAERQLTDAQKQSLDAQIALTDARDAAAKSLQDLESQVANGALAQRQAALDLQDAEARLVQVRALGARATTRQIADAQLGYDQAQQRVADLAVSQERLTADQLAAKKAGIEGSTQVVKAKENIVAADRQVGDAEQSVADARAQAARDAKSSQRQIADAQRTVAAAQHQAADQARQSAFAIAGAQQGVVSAQRAVAASAIKMGDDGSTAAGKYQAALDQLSPAGQRFVEFIRSNLMPGFTQLRKAAEAGLLPGLEAGIKAASPLFAPLLRLVSATATAFGDLFAAAGKALGGPFWTQFVDFMAKTMGPNTEIFGRILGNLVKTFAGLLQAFDPISKRFGEGLARLTEKWSKFADAAASGKSEGFKRFLAYMRDIMPKVSAFFSSFGDALGRVIKGLAPFGADMMAILKVVFDAIAKIPPTVIGAIAAAVLTFAIAWQIAAVATALAAAPIATLVAALVGLAVGLIYAYKHSETFRDIVNGAFHAVADVALWLWHQVLEPTFNGIGAVIGFWWNNIARPVFAALKFYLENVTFPVIRFLYTNIVKPLFQAIGDTISGAWNNVIKPVFTALKDFISTKVAPAFEAGVKGIKAAWDGLKEVAKTPVRFVVETVVGGLIGAINNVSGFFGIPAIPKPGLPKGFATGGIPTSADVVPGYTPGRDTGLIAVGGGEAIMRPEWTRAVGSGYVHAMNAAARAGGVSGVARALGIPGFAGGGIFGDIGDVIKGTAKGAATLGKGAFDFLKNPVGSLRGALSGPLGKLGDLAKNPFTTLVKKFPTFLVDQVLEKAKSLVGFSLANDAPSPAALGGALGFAKAQEGKPYVWGAVGPDGYDCCYRPGTPVLGPDGAKNIEDLQPGDRVWSFVAGELVASRVSAAWRSKDQDIFRVRTRNRDGFASANHPFLRLVPTVDPCTIGGNRGDAAWTTEWTRLDQLRRGDLIVTFQGTGDSIDTDRAVDDSVSPDLAWLLGVFVADGCLNADAMRICVFGPTADRIIDVAAEHWHRKGRKHATAGVIINKASAVRWMRANGFGGKSYEKRVPECVWSWTHEAQREFLRGYADGDGHRPRALGTPDITYKATSRALMADLRALHTLHGDGVTNINEALRTKPIFINGTEVKNARTIYSFEVRYNTRAAAKTSGGLGKTPAAARALVASWNPAFGVQAVLAVEPAGFSPTYDLEIEGAHNFVADGVVVHNSGFMSALTNVLKGANPFHRLFATASFASGRGPAGFVPGGGGLFNIGVIQAHNGIPGHMAGTLSGVNVESRGGQGVVIGPNARGANDGLFTQRFRLAGFDSGGYLPPGVTMAVNNTGRPEPILTAAQWETISRAAAGGDGAAAGRGSLVSIGEFHATPEQSPYAIAQDLAWVTRRRG